MIKAIITDIEGTTTDIDFVHKVLFPYSRRKMHAFLNEHQHSPEVAQEIKQAQQLMQNQTASLDAVCEQLIAWIDSDQKIGPLKTLQGFIWAEGFAKGEYQGHVYQDAYDHLQKWHQAGLKLYVYSSGSVQAQRLLFQYSAFGDMRPLFQGYFDTQVGGKKESASYATILKAIQFKPEETLFLSDVVAELDAAKENGMHTALLNRNKAALPKHYHIETSSFGGILAHFERN
jgi:enolase-phosphatase E1